MQNRILLNYQLITSKNQVDSKNSRKENSSHFKASNNSTHSKPHHSKETLRWWQTVYRLKMINVLCEWSFKRHFCNVVISRKTKEYVLRDFILFTCSFFFHLSCTAKGKISLMTKLEHFVCCRKDAEDCFLGWMERWKKFCNCVFIVTSN